MTLSCANPFKTSNSPGILISLVKIIDVEDISGEQLPFLERPVDIGIRLYLDIGRNFNPEIIIAGNFERDAQTDEVRGWGSAFTVQQALLNLGYQGSLTKDNKIPADILQSIIGKSFYRLSYVSGLKDSNKLRYSDFNLIGAADEGPEPLAKRFQKSVLKGYPKNYHPELLDREDETVSKGEEESSYSNEVAYI